MGAHVVTYANKSSGMFESLVNNEFNVPVKVLGMGTEWKGFSDKVNGYRDYVQTLPSGDIVVIVDGFDTKINGTLEVAVSRFKKLNKPIVVSINPGGIPEAVSKKIFGTCVNGYVGNSGLMMGRVEAMYALLEDMAAETCEDDQRGLNKVCKKHSIYVDADNLIFENTNPTDRNIKTDAVFIGFPGLFTFSRWVRAIREYTQFFLPEILTISLIIALCFKRIRWPVTIFTALLSIFADKSCLNISL